MQSNLPFKRASNPWSRLPVGYRGAIIIAIPAVCLVVTLIAWIWSRQALVNQRQQIEQIDAVIARSDDVLMTMLNAETGVRGYNISRNKQYLEPYQKAVANLHSHITRLEQLVPDNSSQYQTVEEIKQLTQQKLDILKQKISFVDDRNLGTANSPQEVVLLTRGKAVMDEIRAAIAALQQQEQKMLFFYTQERDRVQNITTAIQWTSAFASVIAYLGAVYLFNHLDRELQDRELELQQNTNFIEAITTNMVDGVATLSQEGTIETFNQAASEMFGYDPSEIIGQNWTRLLIDPSTQLTERETQIQAWQERLGERERIWQATGYRKNGTFLPIEISISKIDIDEHWIALIRDLSEHQQAEQRLRDKADELAYLSAVLTRTNLALQKQNQELDKFAYVASHDLKAPLRAIASLSEWIEEDLKDKLPEDSKRMMEMLRGRVFRLEGLMNGLLEYSRIGRIPAIVETTDVKELLQQVIAFLMPPSGFAIEIGENLPVFKTKKRLLREVFLNLIDNAIKHHHSQMGQIKISVCDRAEYYEFAVADDGPGIASEYHDKIFAIFQTLRARDVVENTGIGLSLVKKIVELEGGMIWVESRPGAGATFYFTWLKRSA